MAAAVVLSPGADTLAEVYDLDAEGTAGWAGIITLSTRGRVEGEEMTLIAGGAFALAASGDDAAPVHTLAPGTFLAVMSGAGRTAGLRGPLSVMAILLGRASVAACRSLNPSPMPS